MHLLPTLLFLSQMDAVMAELASCVMGVPHDPHAWAWLRDGCEPGPGPVRPAGEGLQLCALVLCCAFSRLCVGSACDSLV